MTEISIHNSFSELSQTPELIQKLKIDQFKLVVNDRELPYAQRITCPELPGVPILIMFLHGAGSVGHDNFLQLRVSAKPLIEYCEKHQKKAVLLFPQCEQGFQWVDVPWSSESHILPEQPAVFMKLALALLEQKFQEFQPEKLFGLGISMGGYGIWDLACRSLHSFDSLGVICGGADTEQAFRFKNTRVYMLHGKKDPVIPVCRARNMAVALKQANCQNFIYREILEAKHNVWDSFFATSQAFDFLFGVISGGERHCPC